MFYASHRNSAKRLYRAAPSVGLIESMGVRFGWQVRFSVSVSAFSFATAEEARIEREKFIQALEEYWAQRGPYWAQRGPLYQKLTTARGAEQS